MNQEREQFIVSDKLHRYLGIELKDSNCVPEIIKEILELPSSTTGYANFCLKGPRDIQPYIMVSAAVFITEDTQELGLFSHVSPNVRQSLYYYRNFISTIELPDRVIKIDSKRFLTNEQKLREYQDQILFPKFREFRHPIAIMAFCSVFIEKPIESIYLIHHSDVKAQQALDFLKGS